MSIFSICGIKIDEMAISEKEYNTSLRRTRAVSIYPRLRVENQRLKRSDFKPFFRHKLGGVCGVS